MTTTTIVALSVGFVVLDVVVMQTLRVTGVLPSSKKRSEAVVARVRALLTDKNESIVRGPQLVRYSGATGGGYSGVTHRAYAALGERRLVIQTVRGEPMDFERKAIESVRAERWFRRQGSMQRMHVVLQMKAGFEIGFAVRAGAETEWVRDIEAMLAPTPEAPPA